MGASKWAVVVVAVVVVFGSGYGLSRAGKPYNGLLFNAHKLLALAAVVGLVVTLVRANRASSLGSARVAALATGVLVVRLFATGALHSIAAEGGLAGMSPLARTGVGVVHTVFPYLAAVSGALTLYLLRG